MERRASERTLVCMSFKLRTVEPATVPRMQSDFHENNVEALKTLHVRELLLRFRAVICGNGRILYDGNTSTYYDRNEPRHTR